MKHGGDWGPNKSYFIISKEDLKILLQRKDIISTPAIQSVSGNYIRIFDTGSTIGIDKFTKKETSIVSIITDKHGNLINTFPGTTQ